MEAFRPAASLAAYSECGVRGKPGRISGEQPGSAASLAAYSECGARGQPGRISGEQRVLAHDFITQLKIYR